MPRRVRTIPAREVREGDLLHNPDGADAVVERWSIEKRLGGKVHMTVYGSTSVMAPDTPIQIVVNVPSR